MARDRRDKGDTDSRDTALVATTVWPAWRNAAPSTEPTRPADTTPTARRAGRFIVVHPGDLCDRRPSDAGKADERAALRSSASSLRSGRR